ncbi:TetR family transcriptional regulator [Paenibacillus albiflavus]|uniref:TetR family transcriptional regulator n=1 Tax=Paenibacillus albiflavus TaxID=2545760 RepID=A0A4R4DYA1_9BACL|nr:TetR family transcriptional regulator C-terminal domain-containing protein [Paenibacillus albiflavus]TCZ70206.1 TetR family transcriptional regulator [Paenibacillus albiflavus]
MPKQVNHEERKQLIAEAMWRVILEQGMAGATLRNVAKEANLSLGSLRHDFPTQEGLLIYAMELVKERATARIMTVAMQKLPPKEQILRILIELIPTTKETLAEMEVWFAFTAHVRHKAEEFDAMHDSIYPNIQKMLGTLKQANLLMEHIPTDIEAERLYAVVDGLALHAMLDPARVNLERVTEVLQHHLDSIFREE